MRYTLAIALFYLSLLSVGAQDTIFLKGNARRYNDKIVLRWNTTTLSGFLNYQNSDIVIEQQVDNQWQQLSALKPNAVVEPSNKKGKEQLMATMYLSEQLKKMHSTSSVDPLVQMQQADDMKALWMTLSLNADIDTNSANFARLRYSIDIKNNKRLDLVYRVYVKTNNAISDTIYFIPSKATYALNDKPQLLTEEKEQAIELKWTANRLYSSYVVERSGANGQFVKINKAPLVIPSEIGENGSLYYKDSVENYTKYQYRIYGIDMFGDASQYSEVVVAMGRDKTPPLPVSGLTITETNNQQLLVKWDGYKSANDVKGIVVALKNKSEESYIPLNQKILPWSTNNYSIPIETNQTDYYVMVEAFDSVGNGSTSEIFYQLNDNTAPVKPVGLKAVVNAKGIVTLKWKSNNERDLNGYLVYRSSSEKSEFGGIVNVPMHDTFLFDTLSLKLLNREVFYRVVAVDHRLNHSENSETIKVMRPDTLPPVAPLLVTYVVKLDHVKLKFFNSTSLDVTQHILYKFKEGDKQYSKLILNASDTEYIDKDIIENTNYTYYLQAVDESGNISPRSEVVQIRTLKNYFKPAVKVFSALYDSATSSVKIAWDYNMHNVSKVVIYRGTTPSDMSKIPNKIPVTNHSFTDQHPLAGESYYAIKLYFADGTETLVSIPLGVKYH